MATPTLGGWLIHVMRRADGALSLEESLHVIMDSMKDYFPCQSVAVILIDDDTKALRIKISRNISYTYVKQFRKSEPSRTAERVVLEQKPALFIGVSPESAVYQDIKLEHTFTSAVLAPIIKNQRGIGYISCDRTGTEDAFGESDMLHLQVIGYLIGQLMDKFELIARGKKLSQIDDASKALQYKAFVPALATELERGKTHGYPITLALVAVKAFRTYIDTHGIDAAHALLAEVVEIIKHHTTDLDILARFSADEFILCLSAQGADSAKSKLEAIRNSVFETAVGQGDSAINLTVGAVTLRDARDMRTELQDILGALGKRLVDAKNTGSSSVEVGALDAGGNGAGLRESSEG